MKEKSIRTCEAKIKAKGSHVGLSFYAFLPTKMLIPSIS